MKIKTITCHDVYNVGASLQAYALVHYLRQLGHEVEIIDYKPDYLSQHYSLTNVANPEYDKPVLREVYLLMKFPGRIRNKFSKRKKEYDEFTTVFLPTTERRYISNDDLKQRLPEADVYFAGSDQIWNTLFKNGKDPAFYLDFVQKKGVKASYAASFATEDIAEEWKETVRQWLSDLDFISVREQSGVNIIRKLGIDNAEQVLDPVFLLDVDAWTKLEKSVVTEEAYILVYDFDSNERVKTFVKNIAKVNEWKIYSILPCNYADKCWDQEGPRAFLNLIHNAQFIVSNSFHATAFSLIFQKQFAVFERDEKINTRMQDLLKLVGQECRLLRDTNCDIANEKIDYELVLEKLNYKIKESKDYIDRVLRKAKGNEEENTICD